MQPLVITVLAAAALIIISAFLISAQNKRNRKEYFYKLTESFGKRSALKPGPEARNDIPAFSLDRQDTFYRIDDITWNDLGMDEVFDAMNNTASSPGEDVLYYMLRNITDDENELRSRSGYAEYYLGNEDKRNEASYILSGVGRRKNSSVYSRIKDIENGKPASPAKYVLLTVFAAAVILLFFFSPLAGIIALAVLAAFDVHVYLSDRDSDDLQIRGISDISLLLKAGKSLVKGKAVPDSILKDLEETAADLSGLEKSSSLLLAGTRLDSGISGALLKFLTAVFHLDMFSYNRVLRTVKDKRESVLRLFYLLGVIDASVSVASFRKYLPFYCCPEDGSILKARDIYHPLIENAVSNDIDSSGGILITGSNASGKSTFLKTVGIASLLAQSIYTVPAAKYSAPHAKIMSSMTLRDDLGKKESYFMAELKSVKRILDESRKDGVIICLVDEVLRGTNTVERIAASSSLLKELSESGVICFAATHDRELTVILKDDCRNMHFGEKMENGDISFDYRIKEGPAVSGNAIVLMDKLGFSPDLVDRSRKRADLFNATGKWVEDDD